MTAPTIRDNPNPLAAAVARIETGDLDAAEQLLADVLAQTPRHPVAIYLLGVIALERAQWAGAEKQFRQALALAPDQPRVALHLARSLRAQQRAAEAIEYCQRVLKTAPDHRDAWMELAKSQEDSGAMAEAEASYRRLLALTSDPVLSIDLARLLGMSGRTEDAAAQLRTALTTPALDAALHARLEHQLGQISKLQQKHDEALTLMRAAAARAPAGRDQMLEQAIVLRHLRRLDEAAALYDTMLAENPLDMEVHVLRSALRGDAAPDFLASYDAALARAPQAARLPVAKGQLLLKADRPQDAQDAFQRALRLAPDDADALIGLGRALEMLGAGDKARAAYAQGSTMTPDDGKVLEAHAGFLLRQGDAADAQAMAEKALRLQPASQGAAALLSLCWRARGDAREEWLTDYERHVRIFDLEAPAGFTDMDSYNRELTAYLGRQHDGAREYPTQTLRGGTQTHDEIFYNGHALADRLLPRIHDAIKTYVADWKSDAAHPFAARRARGFRHAGSWSSRLADCGFHVNHIHHKGWISSCYYAAVPDVAADKGSSQGWIKFGEPPGEFGDTFTPRRAIQPMPGRLVLFPSYMWHGTVPFHAPQSRVTIAFDAVPV